MAINVFVNKEFAHRNGVGIICVLEKKVFLGESGEPSVVVGWSFRSEDGKDIDGYWTIQGETMYSLACSFSRELKAPINYGFVLQDFFNQVRASINAEMGCV